MPNNRLASAALLAIILGISCAPTIAAPIEIMVPMRDGVELETYVFLPKGDGPFPTLIARTVYGLPISPIGGELLDASMTLADFKPPVGDEDDDNDDAGHVQGWPLITQNGYALVVQNTRGRHGSEGVDRTWRDDGTDGYDLVEWVADQSWSNGRIGMFGDSAVGMSAALAAAAKPPALDAIFLQATAGDPLGTDMAPPDGALRTESLLLQGGNLARDVSPDHIAGRAIAKEDIADVLAGVDSYVQELASGLGDPLSSSAWTAKPLAVSSGLSRLMPFWSLLTDPKVRQAYRNDTNVIGRIEVPTSVVTLWQDTFAESALALFADLESRGVPSELLVVNGTHYDIDDPRVFPQPRMLSWFDRWLKDAPAPSRAIITMAVQSDNVFVETDRLSNAFTGPTRLHLGNGTLTVEVGDPGERAFVSDPAKPVPTLGGRNLLAAAGATDHSGLIGRPDTVLFSGAALDEETTLAGTVTGVLTMASDVPSFDASVRLLDVDPKGTASLILSDHVRVTSVTAGLARVPFDMGEILHRLDAGHRLAVIVAGTDFPAWDRNPQTGSSIFLSKEMRSGTLSVKTGAGTESYIDIPILREIP
jgi:putative CocE/NonD family hydrolase